MPTAILSVHNKTGLIEFAQALNRPRLEAAGFRRQRQIAAGK
ncbi:MAG: hypothetical protein AB9891_06435 [Anaerolineaceae bacterium]